MSTRVFRSIEDVDVSLGETEDEGILAMVGGRQVAWAFGPHAGAKQSGCAPPMDDLLMVLTEPFYPKQGESIIDPQDGSPGYCPNCKQHMRWVQRWGMEHAHAFPANWTDKQMHRWYAGKLRAEDEEQRMMDEADARGWLADPCDDPDLEDDDFEYDFYGETGSPS